jgi:hypothetical protein
VNREGELSSRHGGRERGQSRGVGEVWRGMGVKRRDLSLRERNREIKGVRGTCERDGERE